MPTASSFALTLSNRPTHVLSDDGQPNRQADGGVEEQSADIADVCHVVNEWDGSCLPVVAQIDRCQQQAHVDSG